VCASPNRTLIEAELVAGKSQRDVGGRYGIHHSAIQRHRTNHANRGLIALAGAKQTVPTAPSAAAPGDAPSDRRPAVEQLEAKLAETKAIQDTAEQYGNLNSALVAAKQASALIEQIARLRGEFTPPPPAVIDLTTTPEWLELRSAYMAALEKYPEARQAVADIPLWVGSPATSDARSTPSPSPESEE
jgi:hypothetical protein